MHKSLAFALIAPLTLSFLPNASLVKAEEPIKFVCGQSLDAQTQKRLPTTFAWTPRGKIAIVRWQSNSFPGYPPEKRCQEVSPRFQTAYDNGTINLLTNTIINNKPVICTTKQVKGPCNTMLFTLRPGDNSLKMLNHLVKIFNGEQVGPVSHTGDQRYFKINMQEFLDTAPIEQETP